MDKRICVIGAGRWGRNHIRALKDLACLAGVVEADETKAAEIQAAYPEIRVLGKVGDALAQDFDGFVVATWAETHRELATLIVKHGKPVLVEKPMALTAAEARELKGLAEQNGVSLMVGHLLLFHPAVRKIKELVKSGKIGKLQYIYSNRLNLGTVRTEENILWSFAPHDISMFQYLIGDFPLEVVSRGGAFLQSHIQDSTLTILTYPHNIVGHIFVSWLHPYKEHRLVLVGSKGMLSFDDASEDKNLRFYEKGIDWVRGEPIKREGPTENIPYDRRAPLTEELRYFIDHIDGTPIEIAGPRDAVEVLDILELATKSLLEEGKAGLVTHCEESVFSVHPSSYIDDNVEIGEGTSIFVHSSSYVDENVEIGDGTSIWHFCHIQSGARIGKNCSLGQNVNVGPNVTIGNHVKIQNNVSVYEGVELENYVFCGPSVVFTNILDPRSKYPQRGTEHYRRTRVREGASLGANATIVCGHTIGRHAFIGAGGVVRTDVPDYALMAGVPAKQVGWVCECGQTLPQFSGTVACPRCDLKYRIREGNLVPNV
jgi:UDP-2-acetamido-3-amino-2,3-dideoxy-glucuronate N-acetyltransferase